MGQYDTSAQTPRTGGPQPQVGNGAGNAARDVGNEAKHEARRYADEAKESARHRIDSQREAGASTVDDLADAARGAADRLDEDQPELARYTREAARMADQVSEAIRTRSLGDVVRSADDFARREPVAFFGAALVAGFAISRFLASSSRHHYDEHAPYDPVARSMSDSGHTTHPQYRATGSDDRYRRADAMANPASGSRGPGAGLTGAAGVTRSHEGFTGTEPPERPEVRKGPDTGAPAARSTTASTGTAAADTNTPAGRSTITGSGTTPTSLSKGSGTEDKATPTSRTGRATDPDR